MNIRKIMFVAITGLAMFLVACDQVGTSSTTSVQIISTTTNETTSGADTTYTMAVTSVSTDITTADTTLEATISETTTVSATTDLTTSTSVMTTTSTVPVTTTTTISTLRVFTLSELATYTGSNGSTAYMAVNGIVYDVTTADGFNNGRHEGMQLGGTDATLAFAGSPHPASYLDTLTIVGTLAD